MIRLLITFIATLLVTITPNTVLADDCNLLEKACWCPNHGPLFTIDETACFDSQSECESMIGNTGCHAQGQIVQRPTSTPTPPPPTSCPTGFFLLDGHCMLCGFDTELPGFSDPG